MSFIAIQDQKIPKRRHRIIETAAKLINSEIKNIDVSSDVYPMSAVMSDVEEALKFINY